MAEKGKKSGGGGGKAAAAKKTDTESEKKAPAEVEKKALAKDHAEAAVEKHADAGEHAGAGEHAAHGHKVDLGEVFKVFGVLFALTVLEVGVAKMPGIPRLLVGIALVGLAVTKAACVGFYYMHLKHETKVLKLTVAIPMATPAFYALVLVSEAAWRLTR